MSFSAPTLPARSRAAEGVVAVSLLLAAVACNGGSERRGQPDGMSEPASSLAVEEWPLSCFRFPPVAEEIAHCARRQDDDLQLRPGLVAGEEPEAFLVEGGLVYAVASGRTAPVHLFDNGPDPFVEGRARSPRDGKFGFIDETLSLVVERQWDFAFPFGGGVARVCRGCEVSRPTGEEHGEVVDGEWFLIDRAGKEVMAPEGGDAP